MTTTALETLGYMNVRCRIMGTDNDYALLPSSHPLVLCEGFIHAFVCMEESYTPEDGLIFQSLADSLWELASTIDATAMADAAQFLVAAAVRVGDPEVGGVAAAHLVTEYPDCLLWAAYGLRLIAQVQPEVVLPVAKPMSIKAVMTGDMVSLALIHEAASIAGGTFDPDGKRVLPVVSGRTADRGVINVVIGEPIEA